MPDSRCKDYCWCGSRMGYKHGAYTGFWCYIHGPQERVYDSPPKSPT